MNILVTGGSGFIGSAIVREIEKRDNIFAGVLCERIDVVDTKHSDSLARSNFIHCDITKEFSHVIQQDYNIIFHCAGILGAGVTFDYALETEMVNTIGTLRVLNYAMASYVKPLVVHTSLLGDWPNPYMISKKASEKYGLAYRTYKDVNYVSCRLTVVYGPGQSVFQAKAVPTFAIRSLASDDIVIYGDGSYCVRLVYIDDIARFLVDFAEYCYINPANKFVPIANLTSIDNANYVSVNWLAQTINSIVGNNSKIIHKPMRYGQPTDAVDAGADISQAKDIASTINFSEHINIIDGLTKTVEYYKGLL